MKRPIMEQTNLPVVEPINTEIPTPNIPDVCAPGDKECTTRWIAAFCDCAE